MFADTKAFSGFAVDDLEAAEKFYGQTLGLRTSEQYGLLTLHLAGGRDTLVYPKPDHVPATYTILNFLSTTSTRPSANWPAAACRWKGTTASDRTRWASTGPGDLTSPGSRTRRGTSWRCCKNARAQPGAGDLSPPSKGGSRCEKGG